MRQLPENASEQWSARRQHGSFYMTRPQLIKTRCPHCGVFVAFTSDATLNSQSEVIAMSAKCANCSKKVLFFIECVSISEDTEREPAVFMHPSRNEREDIADIESLPAKIRSVYLEARGTHGGKHWRSACSNCRSTLEGVLKDIWPNGLDRPRNLSRQIRTLADNETLPQPLRELADAIREGGNLAAHLDDDDREPNQAVADAMIKLTDYFLGYVYTLPRMVSELTNELKSLNDSQNRKL
ncbi:MAG: DUF4145 domain-containing protein [Planctomycetaceae bacterium]